MPLFLILLLLASPPATDYLVVTPEALRPELAPLLRHRTDQGHTVRVITLESLAGDRGDAPPAEAIRAAVKKVYEESKEKLAYLLLVGDVGAGGTPTFLPDQYRWTKKGTAPMASDAPFGDMKGDYMPEVAVGRLPVTRGPELARVVRKILRFETVPREGSRRLTLALFAGSSGYAPAVDRFLEGFSRSLLSAELPLRYDLRVVFANESSPYCPPVERLGDAFLGFLNEGPAFSLFLCHASRDYCVGLNKATVRVEKGVQELSFRSYGFGKNQVARLDPGTVSGPCFIFSCLSGAFDGRTPCMAELLLLSEGGPVGVVAASRETHPLPNFYSSQALLEELEKHQTLGDLFLAVQRKGSKKRNVLADMLLKDAEGSVNGPVDVQALRRDQAFLYNLFGDPATPIPVPAPLAVTVEARPGRPGVTVRFENPFPEAKGYAALYRNRLWEPAREKRPDPEKDPAALTKAKEARFKRANDKCVIRRPVACAAGAVSLELDPGTPLAPGTYRVVVYLAAGGKDAAGAEAWRWGGEGRKDAE